jgi:peptidoglycan/LPS O-acetylase OafA/YrhL
MSGTGRLSELDALRGIAALTVALGHFWGAFFEDPEGSLLAQMTNPSLILASYLGHNAVVLFFLLSGFVLAIPRIDRRPQSYGVFLTRRVFRIYLPYVAALALAALGDLWLRGAIPLSDWARDDWGNPWTQPLSWHLVGQHLLFLGFYDFTQINGVFWSLIVEMRVSILFPLLCALVLFLKPLRAVTMALCASAAAVLLSIYFPCPQGVSLDTTLHFAGFFVLGILLAQYRENLGRQVLRWRRGVAGAALATALFFYIFGAFLSDAFLRPLCPHAGDVVADWITALAASLLIVLSMNLANFRALLLTKPCRFLGRISYSVYLIHTPISFILLWLLYGKISVWGILGLFVAATLGLSALFYKFVEEPSMNWGRKVGDRFKRASAA